MQIIRNGARRLRTPRSLVDGVGADVRDGAGCGAAIDVRDGGRRSGPFVARARSRPSEAAAVLRVAAEHELAVVPRGGGSRLGWGTPPSRCDVLVDMSRMDAVLEHAAGDLVARVQAGARMGDVAAVLAQAGQEIALDVPAGATVGGVVASGLAGPRRLRYGSPRDLLIGITIVRADGTVAQVRREGRQERRRLRPRQAVRRVGGDARADHRGDVPAAPAARRAGVRDRRVRRRLRSPATRSRRRRTRR